MFIMFFIFIFNLSIYFELVYCKAVKIMLCIIKMLG